MSNDMSGLTITPELNKKLMLLTAALLEDYEVELSNAGCNDWDFPKDWTHEQALELTQLYIAVSGDEDRFEDGEIISDDVSVVWLLRTMLTGAAEAL